MLQLLLDAEIILVFLSGSSRRIGLIKRSQGITRMNYEKKRRMKKNNEKMSKRRKEDERRNPKV
jgi:hypothetical protein